MGISDQIKGAKPGRKPPNLRMAAGGQGCATCRHYSPTSVSAGRCKMYGMFPVRPTQVSDSFTPKR